MEIQCEDLADNLAFEPKKARKKKRSAYIRGKLSWHANTSIDPVHPCA
jgi:hypothetical protein